MHDEWLNDEIRRGLSKLLCLRLDGTPPADMIEGTAHAWLEALSFRRAWEPERDIPRIREAFTTLLRNSRRWPNIPDFDASLPRIERLLELPAKPSDPERAKRAIAEAQAMLTGVPRPEAKSEPERDLAAGAMAATEAYLQAHYDRKRAAAGDEP